MPTAASGKASTCLLTVTYAADWESLLPVGATLVASAHGDLDSDGDEDTLVVYAPPPTGDQVFRERCSGCCETLAAFCAP